MTDEYRPYVYPVHAHDISELRAAIQQALETPIERYIPPEMSYASVRDKVGELVEWDWQAEAGVAREEMSTGGDERTAGR